MQLIANFPPHRTVFEKSTMDRLVVLLIVSETEVQFHFGGQIGQNFSVTMRTAGHIGLGQWTHLALQVGCMCELRRFSWLGAGRSPNQSKQAVENVGAFRSSRYVLKYSVLSVAGVINRFRHGPKSYQMV